MRLQLIFVTQEVWDLETNVSIELLPVEHREAEHPGSCLISQTALWVSAGPEEATAPMTWTCGIPGFAGHAHTFEYTLSMYCFPVKMPVHTLLFF